MVKHRNDDNKKLDIDKIIKTGWELAGSDFKKAMHHADKAEQQSRKLEYEVGIAASMILRARIHANLAEYPEATKQAIQGRAIARQINDVDWQIKADHVLGFMCNSQGNLESALLYYNDGLRLMKENERDIEPAFLNNIAVIYYDIGKSEDAMELYQQAYELAERQGTRLQGLILSNIAEIHLANGNIEKALEYNNNALNALQESNEQDHFLATCYNMFGLIYAHNKQFELTVENFQNSLKIYRDLGQKYMEAIQLIEIGKFYLHQDNHEECVKQLQLAIKIAEDTASEGALKDACILMSNTYEKQQDFQKAFDYLRRYNSLNEKIKTKQLDDRLAQQIVEQGIEKAQKDAEIERLKNIELQRQADENELKAELLEVSFRDIQIIGEIGQELTATLDFRKLNNLIYKNIQKLMEADVFGICLYNHLERCVEFKLFIEEGKRLPLYQIMIDNEMSLAAKCVKTGSEIFINSVEDQSSILIHKSNKPDLKPQSIIYYPLRFEGQVIGAITVQSKRQNAYTDRTLEMLKALASYMAIALNNSQKSEELKAKTRELELLSKTDALTGLYNRRHIMERLIEEKHRFDRTGRLFSVSILDIDHFKNVNDIYGHDYGDYTLVSISKVLKSFMRKQDIVARWGGEEFLILLPDTDKNGAMALCERIRQNLADRNFTYKRKRIRITATFGVAEYNSALGVDAVINTADKALYEGKNQGRNRVTTL